MNNYDPVVEFQTRHRIVLPYREDWRSCPPLQGEINGLPQLRGRLAITNGILAYLEPESDHPPFLVHLGWFIPDKPEAPEAVELLKKHSKLSRSDKRATSVAQLLDKYGI